jgi:hypothetical protein
MSNIYCSVSDKYKQRNAIRDFTKNNRVKNY